MTSTTSATRVDRDGRGHQLILDVQARGLRVEAPMDQARPAGPAPPTRDAVDRGLPGHRAHRPRRAQSPYVLRPEDDGYGDLPRRGRAWRRRDHPRRPRYYDLTTADGMPYWHIALLHLDSVASTVVQHCAYWGNADQCTFCGIGRRWSPAARSRGRRPEQLAEVAVAARDLDGAVDATLTTGSTRAPTGARCTSAVRRRR